jgi:hypothetical protein
MRERYSYITELPTASLAVNLEILPAIPETEPPVARVLLFHLRVPPSLYRV